MVRDTETTKRKLLAAAVDEFAARGYSGARIQEISNKSGCNRERIYFYFGSKSELFEAAVKHELVTALDLVPIDRDGVEGIVEFATRYFDLSVKRPHLSRLMLWEGLELGQPLRMEQRIANAERKVAEIHKVLPTKTASEAEVLLLTVVTLCNSLIGAPNVYQVIMKKQGQTQARNMVIDTTRVLAAHMAA